MHRQGEREPTVCAEAFVIRSSEVIALFYANAPPVAEPARQRLEAAAQKRMAVAYPFEALIASSG